MLKDIEIRLTFNDTDGLIFEKACSKCDFLTDSFSLLGFLMNSLRANSDDSRTRALKSAPLKGSDRYKQV